MTITSAIKLTQGPNTDLPGRAVFGTLTDGEVSFANGDNTGVLSWTWTMVDVPPGSAIPVGLMSTASSGSFAQPDVRGGYLLELTVGDGPTIGTSTHTATSQVTLQVKEASGRYIPPFMATDEGLQFGGQKRGWATCMEEWLHYVDSIPVPGLVITGFSANVGLVETGQSVPTPGFTASYSGPAVLTAVMTNNANGESRDVHSTPTAFTSAQTYVKNTPNQSVTFTLNATGTAGPAASARTTSITWGQKNFFGVSTGPANTEAFIESLTGQLNTSRNTTFTVNASGSNKIYFGCPTRYGTPTFTVGGFVGGFILRATGISVTNAQGFTETYDLWESVAVGLDTTTVSVT